MSILDQLRERQTGMYRTSDFGSPAIAQMDCNATGEIRPHTLSDNTEYELAATIYVRFWANRAQYAQARKVAERVLLQRLYGGNYGAAE